MLLLSFPKGLPGVVHDGADRVFLYACSRKFTFSRESVDLSSFINLFTIFPFISENYLLFSTLITLFISFHRSQNRLNQDLGTTLNNQSLSQLQINTQDLGMQIDRNSCWTCFEKFINRSIYAARKTDMFCNIETLKIIHLSVIHPIICLA